MDDSTIMCDKVIESYNEDVVAKLYCKTKTIPTNFNEKKATAKLKTFIFYLYFY